MRKLFADIEEEEEENEINITPMLDVVFIMLIFFIVTASFVREVGLDVNRPDSQTNKPQEAKKNILVRIGGNNEIWIGGLQVDARAVRANIERLHAENPEGAVVIQADKQAYTDTLIQVMDAARQVGIYNVSLAEPV